MTTRTCGSIWRRSPGAHPGRAHQSPLYGWAGWIHWETSGAHVYVWDVPRLFFSVDVCACKAFSAQAVVELTREWFDATDVVFKEF